MYNNYVSCSCERGYALRGEDDEIGPAAMATTVYLGMLELVAHYYDFLKHHTQKLANLGSSSYKLCTCRQQSVKSVCNSCENVFWVRSFLASNVPSRPTIESRVFQCQTRSICAD